MRADEFITEAQRSKILHNHDKAIPNAKLMPRVDQGYGLYRFGLLMASSPDEPQIDTFGASGNMPFFIPYSKGDEQIISGASKAGGFGSARNLTHGKSQESDDVHKISPVRATKSRRRRPRN